MVKKKKGSRRRRFKAKKKGGSKRKAEPIASKVGSAYTIFRAQSAPLVSGNLTTYQINAIKGLWDPAYADYTKKVVDETVYYYKLHGKPMAAGLLVSHGDALPFVGKPYHKLVQKPLNKLVRRFAGKGWRA